MNNFDLLLSANLDFNVIFIVVSACLLFAGLVLFLTFAKRPKFLTKSNHIVCDKKNASFSTRNRKSHNIFSIMIIPTLLIVLLSTFCISLSSALCNNTAHAANTDDMVIEKELPLDCLVSIDGRIPAKIDGSDIVKISYYYKKPTQMSVFYGEIHITLQSGSKVQLAILHKGTLTLYDHHAEKNTSFNERYPAESEEARKNNLKDRKINNVFCVGFTSYYGTVTGSNGEDLKNTYYIVQDFSSSWYNASWIDEVNDFLDKNLVTIITALLIGSVLLAIILGIFLAKAESADAIAKAKKRMWGLLVGVVLIIVLILVLRWVLDNFSHVQEALDEIHYGSDGRFLYK